MLSRIVTPTIERLRLAGSGLLASRPATCEEAIVPHSAAPQLSILMTACLLETSQLPFGSAAKPSLPSRASITRARPNRLMSQAPMDRPARAARKNHAIKAKLLTRQALIRTVRTAQREL